MARGLGALIKAQPRWPLAGLFLLLFALLIWQLKPGPWERRTETLLTQIQAVQKLQVLEARLLAHQTIRDPALFNTNEFVVLAQGKAIYGLDLAQAHLQREGETMKVQLPPIRLMELIVNPADLEFIGLKKGLLTSQADFETRQREAAIALQAELARQARDPALLQQARDNARRYLESLLTSLKFDKVEISFDGEPAIPSSLKPSF